MPVSLVARKNMRYGVRSYVAGEVFEARDAADAAVLVKIGMAAHTPSHSHLPDESAEPIKVRSYRRRDLTAENE